MTPYRKFKIQGILFLFLGLHSCPLKRGVCLIRKKKIMEMKTNNHVWGQYKNRIVICSGCHDKIKRCEARFVLWDGAPCHFCCICIATIHNSSKNGRPIMTYEELLKEKRNVTKEDLSNIQRLYPR